jgi:hypothetical protein
VDVVVDHGPNLGLKGQAIGLDSNLFSVIFASDRVPEQFMLEHEYTPSNSYIQDNNSLPSVLRTSLPADRTD